MSLPDLDLTCWPAETAERYRQAGYWTGQLLTGLIDPHVAARPQAPAVIGPDARLSYAGLAARIAERTRLWRQLGNAPGDYAVLQLPNSAEFVVALLSLWQAGAVPVMALATHRHAEIAAFARQAGAAVHVCAGGLCGTGHHDLAATVRAGQPGLITALHDGTSWVIERDPRPRSAHPRLLPPEWESLPESGKVALLQLSGGSTGTPKLIPRTHDDYLCCVRESARLCGLGPGTRYLVTLPAAHNFAMSSPGILGTLLAGGTVVMAPDPSPATAFGLIERERITLTAVVPPVAQLWLRAARRPGRDLSSLRVLQVGGARLPDIVAAQVTDVLGCQLQQVFGMAEGLVCYTRDSDPGELITTTQGRPVSPADEIKVVDDDDRELPDGEPGHLLTRGPYTIRGYFRAGEHNASAFTPDGYYRTGDLVIRYPSGHLSVVGRAKDQINRGGEKIAVIEVEGHLLAHPGVAEVSLIAEPDPLLGERARAVIVPSGPPPGVAELRAWLHERGLASFKIPDQFTFASALPRTRIGKTDLGSLRTRTGRTTP